MTIKIKPLEWEEGANGRWTSEGGYYQIQFMSEPYTDADTCEPVRFCLMCPLKDNMFFKSLEAAKAAAQADYERRIVSALEPAPLTPAEARENVVDIIEEIICETHDLDVRDRDYAENVVAWLEKYHPAALRAIACEEF